MWPFKRKLAWEVEYAQNIYGGLVAHNELGDITALKLRIPTTLHHAYQNKILLQRELIAFVALMESGDGELQKVMLVFGDLLVSKCTGRSLGAGSVATNVQFGGGAGGHTIVFKMKEPWAFNSRALLLIAR